MVAFGQSAALPVPVLATLTVVTPGSFFIRNRDIMPLRLIFDAGAPPASLIVRLVPGDVAAPQPAFTGRVQVVGPIGAAFDAISS
jgi:hypothetical protein